MSLDDCMEQPVEVLGHWIELKHLENPKLKRLLREKNRQEFLFHRKSHYTEDAGVVQHTDHTDHHKDNHQDRGYSESAGTYTGKGRDPIHSDHHVDKGYSEHTDHTGR